MIHYKKNLVMMTALLPLSLFSANKVYLEKSNYTLLNTIEVQNLTKISKQLNTSLGFSNNISLEKIKTYKSKNGKKTTRFLQHYKGIPVVGGDIIIATYPNSFGQKVYGSALYHIDKDIHDIKATITEKEAFNIAKNNFTKKSIKRNKDFMLGKTSKKSIALKIWKNKKNIATLIYEVEFMLMGKDPSKPHYYIDAKTGKILKSFDNLMHANATGPGGNEKTGQYTYGGAGSDYGYLNVTQNGSNCIMENTNVKTVDLNHDTDNSKTTPFSFACPENTYQSINGGYSPLNDAHYFGGITFNMYNDYIGVSPLTSQLVLKVHYDTNYENAFWDGTAMTFGDGADILYPLVDIDVTAHEVSHGFTEQNSNLIYEGKAGGLNEAFSDIAGEAAEYYLRGNVDWACGADIMKNGDGFRFMDNPPLDGYSIDNQADYEDSLDVHESSGVYNKAYYLLSTTSGWDPEKAFKVYAKANQEYWTSDTDWDNAGAGLLNAASDLGYETDAVCSSLNSVGIFPQISSCPNTPPPPPPSYTIFNLESEWTTQSDVSVSRGDTYYAKYYSFTLKKTTEVTINLESNEDTYMYLLDSAANIVTEDDDGGDALNSKIVMRLDPGTYTVEATTFSESTTGTFTLNVTALGTKGKYDFNNDGISDIFWRSGSTNHLWMMHADGSHSWVNIGGKASTYVVAGIEDLNGDGITDILWRKGYNNYIWYMHTDGSHDYKKITSKSYSVVAVEDFNNDGIADILWRKDNKNNIWYMNADGTHVYQNIGTKPNTYTIAKTADYNGDNITDILWRKGSANYLWYMHADGSHTYKKISGKSTAYSVQ